MPDPADLLRAWEAAVRELGGLAGSLVHGSAEMSSQLAGPLQRQTELLEQIMRRQLELERELIATLTTPARTVLDLSAQTAEAMAQQARAFRSASVAMGQAADLLERQAELFGAAIATVRDPLGAVRAAGESIRQPPAPPGAPAAPAGT
jgi:hypothetical protein